MSSLNVEQVSRREVATLYPLDPMERFRRNPAKNPTGVPPTGTLPTGTLPTGTLPSGTLPSGTLPSGGLIDETGELVRRAQAGQSRALNSLFGRFRPTLLNMARSRLGSRLRSKEDPEDLTQTTFREAVRDFPRYEYRGQRSFLNWLARILQNKIRDKAEFYSAAKRDSSRESRLTIVRPDGDDLVFEPASMGPSATRTVERDEEFEILHEHLEQLSALHREALRLVFFDGLTLREAGRRMDGRSEDAVRMLVRRAADHLRATLDENDGG